MKPRARARSQPWLLAVGLLVLVAGCTSVVSGDPAGTASGPESSPSSSAGSSPSSPSSASTTPAAPRPNAKFPRLPAQTAIGDPVTADLCSAIDLSGFSKLSKYKVSYAEIAYPPGCSVAFTEGSELAFTTYVFGVPRRNSFSHLSPVPQLAKLPVYVQKLYGLTVKYFAFRSQPLGDCQRTVVTSQVNLRVQVNSRAAPGKASRSDDCAAADVMVEQVAKAVSTKSIPRLKLATPSLAGLDFCAALRAVDLSGSGKYAEGKIAPDGLSGCTIHIHDSFLVYLDFAITKPAAPGGATAKTIGGHRLYVGASNDDKAKCTFVSTQGTTSDGQHEQILAEAGDYSDTGSPGLCTNLSKILVRFLDVTGLT